MVGNVLVDAGFVVALLSRRDTHHRWAVAQATRFPPPWKTCDAALSETYHLIGQPGGAIFTTLLRRRALTVPFDLDADLDPVLRFMQKYADVPYEAFAHDADRTARFT